MADALIFRPGPLLGQPAYSSTISRHLSSLFTLPGVIPPTVLQQDLPGEWDHKLPKKEPRETTPEWKPRSIAEKLWDDLDRMCSLWELFMGVVKDLLDHYGREKLTRKDDK
jgi:hypothetical protein